MTAEGKFPAWWETYLRDGGFDICYCRFEGLRALPTYSGAVVGMLGMDIPHLRAAHIVAVDELGVVDPADILASGSSRLSVNLYLLSNRVTTRMLLLKCCFEPLYAPERCLQRQRYLDAEAFIVGQGVRICHPDHEWWAWKAGRSQKYGHDRYIDISSVAYRIYGWDVMTSVLVHEFGHCDLFNEGISEGASPEENLDIENRANQRGFDIMPSHLVPEAYWEHRAFFLRSYLDSDWTAQKCLEAWANLIAGNEKDGDKRGTA